ncbi:Wadjet anti-phage system protein JetD domain-containing protein [Salinarimonas sp. NSM]|uniref:Wadjet anti-phage system protein JetD domain-containing protein n=1 Tax=Salinarimonas sp. NSM TaxID=3458003 RepID=UPI00403753D3
MRVDYERIPRRADARAALERSLALLERENIVALDRRRGARHLIDRVVLVDADALARRLGVVRLGDQAQTLEEAVKEAVPVDGALGRLLADCVARWRRGEPAYGLRPEEQTARRAVERFKLLQALLAGAGRGLDRRTFSVRSVGRSKALEAHQGMLCQMLRRIGAAGLSDEDVLGRLGLERFMPQVLASGGFDVHFPPPDADARLPGTAFPYVCIDPAWLGGLCLRATERRAVLTIENLATFNRYVREIRDPRHIVVYTGGFPAQTVVGLLRRLRDADPGAAFFHWGDIDEAGFEIVRFLERELDREVTPFLMCPVLLEALGSAAGTAGDERRLEQETLSPSPLPW